MEHTRAREHAGSHRLHEGGTGIWLLRPEAEAIGARLSRRLGGEVYRPWDARGLQAEQFAAAYPGRARWIVVGTTAIAVRFLEGLHRNRRSDPPVVVLDEGCRFAVSLLGGRAGGGNRLAYQVANIVGAVPVVTSASEALRPLVVGIGCRDGASAEMIGRAIRLALGGRPLAMVREVATLDLRADEPGLLEFCDAFDLPLRVIRRAAVRERAPAPSGPDAVDGVCAPCALLASPRGRLVMEGSPVDGVSVALVEDVGGLEG